MNKNNDQIKYLEILKTIEEISRKDNIRYMLTCGTLLGAIREKGFIEWDNDADIMMLRSDFNKFEANSGRYNDDYGLLLDYQDKLPTITLKQNPDIFTEIVLVDSLPSDKIKRTVKLALLKTAYGMLKTDYLYSNYPLKKKIFAYGTAFLGKLFSKKAKLNLYKSISQIGNKENPDLAFFSNERFVYLKLVFKMSLLDEIIRVPFENTELSVPKEWDTILRLYYGDDYMVPKRYN